MKNLTLSLEESIPHLDSNWIPMQMIKYRFAVTASQEEWETPEKLREQLEKEFTTSRDYVYNLTDKWKKFNAILKTIKEKYPQVDINNIINSIK